MAETIKMKGLSAIRKGKSASQPSMYNQANGMAIIEETRIRTVKLRNNRPNKVVIEAPKTFLIPISFLRCSVTYAAKPNKPKQAILMASPANTEKIVFNLT